MKTYTNVTETIALYERWKHNRN